MIDALVEIGEMLLLAALAPAVVGYVRWIKARLQSRRGASTWQPYRDLWKTFRKNMVIAETASWIFHAAPAVVFGAVVGAATLVPVLRAVRPADAVGDLFVLAALLMLSTAALALGGLDTGTAFGGMGSSREMTVAALTEPTIAVAILAVALTTGSTSLGNISAGLLHTPESALGPGHVLAFTAFIVALLAEAGRLPIDNPSTHLELTMIHEAMVLEYSGPYLAIIEWASAIKLMLLLTLAANLFLPWGLATSLAPGAMVIAGLALISKIGVLATVMAAFETRVAKVRLFRVPELLALSFALAVIAAASSFFTR